MEIWIVSIVLIISLVLLVTEKISVDVTAVGMISVLAITRILSPQEAIAGFANPAVITVAAMFLISRALIKTGAVGLLYDRVIQFSGTRSNIALCFVFFTVALSSGFINNTPVVVLFIPVLMSTGVPIWFQPVQISHSPILCIHFGGDLYSDRDIHQYSCE